MGGGRMINEKSIAMIGGFVIIIALIAWGIFLPDNKDVLGVIKDLSLLILGGIYGAAQIGSK